ncbi:hypothetical protein NMG60_11024183 [Bertholletia excelsa]
MPANSQVCDLQIHVNGHHTFFVNEEIISKFGGKLRTIIEKEKRITQIRSSGIEINGFPGGPDGFELVSRFCYNSSSFRITVSNVSHLHCCAMFLGMSDDGNLLQQTETFLRGMFYWSWSDILTALKSCEPFISHANSCGLVERLMSFLMAKIAQNSDLTLLMASPSANSVRSSPSNSSSSPGPDTPTTSTNSTPNKAMCWWFDDMTILPPNIIGKFVKTLGAYGRHNNSLVLTRFLLHYLKSRGTSSRSGKTTPSSEYGGLAETAVHGVIVMGKKGFSCRSLFWVLRIVSGLGLSRECGGGLERLIGGMLDEAKLDDLLVCAKRANSGPTSYTVYDVNLVVRLVRLFVHDNKVSVDKMKKVGRLIDNYLGEIAPDHNLKISKFLAVAESLPDFARDTFDGVYRAVDIFLESHPNLPLEERSRLCRCINYEKLSLEACKDLAKNPRIPPRIAVEALASQKLNIFPEEFHCYYDDNDDDHYHYNNTSYSCTKKTHEHQMVVYKPQREGDEEGGGGGRDIMKLDLQKMQWRVVELEKLCREMKGQMSSMVKDNVLADPPQTFRSLSRLC